MQNRDVVAPPAQLSVAQGQKQAVFERHLEAVGWYCLQAE
jgi:hypothetical protein